MRIAFDCELMRPGCVILQAALGGSAPLAMMFPTESWLVAPTKELKVREITEAQLDMLVRMVCANYQTIA